MPKRPSFLESIHDLEVSVEKDWAKQKYKISSFNKVAQKHLSTFSHRHFQLDEIYGSPQVLGLHSEQGQSLLLTLKKNERFFINLYIWFDHTDSHSHNFCGAFKLLQGRSFEMNFKFKKEQMVEDVEMGKLELLSQEELVPGDVRSIALGDKYIHQVYHRERPTVTLSLLSREIPGQDYHHFHYPGLKTKLTDLSETERIRLASVRQLTLMGKDHQKQMGLFLRTMSLNSLINFHRSVLPSMDMGKKLNKEFAEATRLELSKRQEGKRILKILKEDHTFTSKLAKMLEET